MAVLTIGMTAVANNDTIKKLETCLKNFLFI